MTAVLKRLIPAELGSNAAEPMNGSGARRPKLELRRATPLDFVPLCFFFDTVLRRDYFLRRGQLQDMLKSPYHQIYIAEVDAVLVGVAITTRATRLVNALVHPNFRGLGIGRALVDFSGATEVRAKLDMSTGDPRGFYQSMGFASAGRTGGKRNIEVMRVVRPDETPEPNDEVVTDTARHEARLPPDRNGRAKHAKNKFNKNGKHGK